MANVNERIKQRRGSASQWAEANPTLLEGEIAFEVSDTGVAKMKIGDGVTPWNSLDYAVDFDAIKDARDAAISASAGVSESASAASASATAAATSESNAAASAATAQSDAESAAASKTSAQASETNASGYATAAATSESNAAASATAAQSAADEAAANAAASITEAISDSETATSNANSAATSANEATSAANTATGNANTATDRANAAAEAAEQIVTGGIPTATTTTKGAVIVGSGLSVTADGTISADLTEATVDAKISALGAVMKWMGQVADYASLPTDATAGDTYNVIAENGEIPAGTNYTWSGTDWDALAGAIDLSSYALGADVTEALAGKADVSHEHSADDITSGTLPVAHGGTGAQTLAGLAYGNGTDPMTPATAAQVVAAIGSTAVERATSDASGNNIATTYATKGEVSAKQSAATITTATMAAASWSAGVYSFEATYPFATYDIEVFPSSTMTAAQMTAWIAAKPAGSATANTVTAFGTVPAIDIPVVIKVVAK